MKSLLRNCCLAALVIPCCESFAEDAKSLIGAKVIVVTSDVELTSDKEGIWRAQYGDVATVEKVDGQKLWLQEKGGWIRADKVIPAEDAVQTWHKRFSDMQDQTKYDSDVALKFTAALSAYNQMTAAQKVASQIIQHDPSVAEAYRLRGACLMLDKKFAEALADFDHAVSLKPQSADLRVNRAICQVGIGQFDAAIKQLTAVLSSEANHIDALYQRGTVYKLQGQHDAALLDYERVLRLSPQHIKALRKRANLLRSLGENDRAAADARMWLKTDPDDSRTYILLGDIYRDADEPEKAIEIYSQGTKVPPYRPLVWSGRGLALLMLGKREEAASDFREAIELYPQHVPALLELGRILLDDGEDLQAAQRCFQQAREEEPQNADVHAGMGELYLARNELDKAIGAYTEALKLAPDTAWILTNRGVAYDLRSQLPEAIADYSRAIELDPEDPQTWMNRGNVYLQQAEYDKAITDYTKGIAVDPENVDLYTSRADALMALGDSDSLKAVIADSEKAMTLAPENFHAYTARAYANQELGELDAAIADFRKAINLDGPKGEAHRLLGYAQFLNGDSESAVKELDAAIGLNEESAENWRIRGIVHRGNGSYELSKRDLLNAIALAPDDADIFNEVAYTFDEMWKFDDALEATERALQIAPHDVRALNYRAYVLGCGPHHLLQPENAVKHALKANELSDGENAAVLDTLACAYAATGNFQQAEETGKLAIAKAIDDETVRKDATAHLELFRQKQAFRLPEDRPVHLEVGPPVEAVAAIDGAVDVSFVPAECFAVLVVRPEAILSSPHLKAFSADGFIQTMLGEFGADVRHVSEVMVPLFPSRDLPPAFLIRFNLEVGPDRVAAHPALDVEGWSECDYSGRHCFTKFGRVTCFVDNRTVITGPRAAVKRMLATDNRPSLLRNVLGQTKNNAALALQVEFSVCPKFIAEAAKSQAENSVTATFAPFMPHADSFTGRFTSADHVVLTATAEMNNAVTASRLNLTLNEALLSLKESTANVGDQFRAWVPAVADDATAIVHGLLANTTLSASDNTATLSVTTDSEIEATIQRIGAILPALLEQ